MRSREHICGGIKQDAGWGARYTMSTMCGFAAEALNTALIMRPSSSRAIGGV